MKRLWIAATSPFHIAVLLLAVAASVIFFTLELTGWAHPDYRRLCFVLVLAYVVGVVIELRPTSRSG